MKPSRWLWLAVLSVCAACNIYNDALLEDAKGRPGSGGGSATGGAGSDTGGAGTGTGAAANTGGDSTDGGTGGENMGGSPDGGSGGSTGGSSGGGSGGDGGTGGGAGGSTGGVPSATDLVDDLASETLVFSNAPFFGTWTRYAQPSGIVWVPTPIDGMVAADGGNFALHANATFTVDDWGVDLVLPLQDSGASYVAYDLSGYWGVRFRAKRGEGGTSLKISLEDEASHRGSTLCMAGSGGGGGYLGADCDNHAVAPPVGLTTSWKEFYVPLTSFTSGVSGARDEPLDATNVYAIHFQMNPSGTTPVDFWLDDIYLVEF